MVIRGLTKEPSHMMNRANDHFHMMANHNAQHMTTAPHFAALASNPYHFHMMRKRS